MSPQREIALIARVGWFADDYSKNEPVTRAIGCAACDDPFDPSIDSMRRINPIHETLTMTRHDGPKSIVNDCSSSLSVWIHSIDPKLAVAFQSLSSFGRITCLVIGIVISCTPGLAGDPIVLPVWPDVPPGETKTLPPEADQTKPEDQLIAGRRIIKLGNVSTPQIAVYQPAPERSNGAAVVICPGGGHHILAYDLEGTEVAQWLNSLGVTGIVLKYRVPFRDPQQRWRAAVQDAQRAMSLVRHQAESWNLDPQRIGICGFSAGGQTAALTSIFLKDRTYETSDAIDQVSCRPDFAMLIYAGGLVQDGTRSLHEYIQVTPNVPPMFFVHAYDDRVSVHNSLALAADLKDAEVPCELHVYASGGHGYGLRETEMPVTRWPEQAEAWMKNLGLLVPPNK